MSEIRFLREIREQLDQEEAMAKFASLEEMYGDDDIRVELYNEAIDVLTEKVANGELDDMGPSNMVTMAAALTEEAYSELEKEASAEEYYDDQDDEEFTQDELEEAYDVIDEILYKEANIDLEEVLATEDADLIDEAASLAAELLQGE